MWGDIVSEAQGPGWTGAVRRLVAVLVHLFQSIRAALFGTLLVVDTYSTGPLLLGKVAQKADGHPSLGTEFRLLTPAALLPHKPAVLRVESGNCPAYCPVHGSSVFIMAA